MEHRTERAAAAPLAAGEASAPRPWAGRVWLLVGVVLLGLSLRHAVTGVAPLLATISADIGMGAVGATILGMLPTIAFGVAGFLTPLFIGRIGLTQTAVLALLLGALGTVVRVFADGPGLFLGFGALALFGMGMGNVVGPPLVKRYFPDRQATAMSLLVLMTQGGATLPAMLALPLEAAGGCRHRLCPRLWLCSRHRRSVSGWAAVDGDRELDAALARLCGDCDSDGLRGLSAGQERQVRGSGRGKAVLSWLASAEVRWKIAAR